MNANVMNFRVAVDCLTYNHAPYITETMAGFCAQKTDFPFVCIIIDDASTDGEQLVIQNYLDAYFDQNGQEREETDDYVMTFARNKENQNCFFIALLLKYNHHRLKKAKIPYVGEWHERVKYIALCEGDDYWTSPDKIQMQVELMEKYRDSPFCVTDYREYNEYIKDFQPHQLEINRSDDSKYLFLSMDDFLHRGFFTKTLTVLYRQDMLASSNYNLYKARYDMPMFFALLTQGNCIFINEEMGVYRLSNVGVTSPVNREKFIDSQLPALFSIIRIEKSRESQLFVYNFMVRYIIYVIYKKQFEILKKCITLLPIDLNCKLFVIELPKQVFSILEGKFRNNG